MAAAANWLTIRLKVFVSANPLIAEVLANFRNC